MKGNNENKTLSVAWLGESGFPYGLAAIQKTIVLGDGLTRVGVDFVVINRKGKLEPGEKDTLEPEGEFEGIKYVYASGITYRPKGFVARNLMKVKGAFNELLLLRKMQGKDRSLAVIVSNHSYLQCLLYIIYGKIFNFPVVYLYVEMASTMQHRVGTIRHANDYLFDRFLVKKMDAVLPISEFLIDNFKKIAPGKPFMKIPTICNFDNFDVPKRKVDEPYLLFCGAFDYLEIIQFITQAFKKLDASIQTRLYLIISKGTSKQYKEFNEYLEQNGLTTRTKIFSNIPFAELVDLYVNASALLIPLRPTKQDAARFPHKIAEYTATGNPIISTNYGEVKYYFNDGDNALIANSYDPEEYAEKMKFVVENPEEAKKIGQRGKELGTNNFSHVKYGPMLKEFLLGLK